MYKLILEQMYHGLCNLYEIKSTPTIEAFQHYVKTIQLETNSSLGLFQGHYISANGKQVDSKFYVAHSSNSDSILGKYTAFDLDIFKVSVKELTKDLNTASAPFCSSVDLESTVHMSYSEMAKKLTPLSQVTQAVNEIYENGTQITKNDLILNSTPENRL